MVTSLGVLLPQLATTTATATISIGNFFTLEPSTKPSIDMSTRLVTVCTALCSIAVS
jgi:hypothetical protein